MFLKSSKKVKGFCQSCSMPLSKDKQGGGTETDGRLSTEFCSFCYKNGEFIEPNLTLEEMKKKLTTVMQKQQMPRMIIWLVMWKLSGLKRWR